MEYSQVNTTNKKGWYLVSIHHPIQLMNNSICIMKNKCQSNYIIWSHIRCYIWVAKVAWRMVLWLQGPEWDVFNSCIPQMLQKLFLCQEMADLYLWCSCIDNNDKTNAFCLLDPKPDKCVCCHVSVGRCWDEEGKLWRRRTYCLCDIHLHLSWTALLIIHLVCVLAYIVQHFIRFLYMCYTCACVRRSTRDSVSTRAANQERSAFPHPCSIMCQLPYSTWKPPYPRPALMRRYLRVFL